MGHILQGRTLHYYLTIMGGIDLSKELGGTDLYTVVRSLRRLGCNDPVILNGSPLVRLLHALIQENDLRQILLGFPHYGPSYQLAETLRRLFGVTEVPTDTSDFYARPENDTYPGMPITAEHILESLGIIKEALYANEYQEIDHDEIIPNAPVQYTFAMSYARSMLEDRFDWEFQPVELDAALNLALWPPFVPSGLTSHRAWRWDDIEPGYRFCRMIEWLSERSEPLTSHEKLTPDERNSVVSRFFSEASEYFDWTHPRELAEAWIDHLSGITPWSKTQYYWWCLSGEPQLRTRYSLRLLKEFRDRPHTVWFLPQDEPVISRPTFQFILYTDVLEVPEHHLDETGSTAPARFESYIFHGMKNLLKASSFQGFNQDIVDQHLRLISQFFEQDTKREMASINCDYLRRLYGL